MVKGKRWARMLAGVAVLTLVSAACGDDGGSGDGNAPEGLTGSITISGSSHAPPFPDATTSGPEYRRHDAVQRSRFESPLTTRSRRVD